MPACVETRAPTPAVETRVRQTRSSRGLIARAEHQQRATGDRDLAPCNMSLSWLIAASQSVKTVTVPPVRHISSRVDALYRSSRDAQVHVSPGGGRGISAHRRRSNCPQSMTNVFARSRLCSGDASQNFKMAACRVPRTNGMQGDGVASSVNGDQADELWNISHHIASNVSSISLPRPRPR